MINKHPTVNIPGRPEPHTIWMVTAVMEDIIEKGPGRYDSVAEYLAELKKYETAYEQLKALYHAQYR